VTGGEALQPQAMPFGSTALKTAQIVARQNCQNPSSASPTQLTTNIDDVIAAKVTMVLTDLTKRTPMQAMHEFCRTNSAPSRREIISIDIESDCGCDATGRSGLARKNPHLRH
jgi:hypothetical protein